MLSIYDGAVNRRLTLLFALYFCQGLPGGFLAHTLPAVLRQQGQSLATIGFAGLLSLPWFAKVLWAPLVDRYGSERFGRRRSWLVPAQAGMVATTLAFVGLNPQTDLVAIAGLFLVLNLFAATQDVATDAWAIDLLPRDDLGPGNSAQVAGFKVGNLVGGGVLLSLIAVIGWSGDFLVMAGLVGAVLLFVLATPEVEPKGEPRGEPEGESHARVLGRLTQAIRQQGAGLWLFSFYAKFGETLGGAMLKPMLVDRGFALGAIGIVDGIAGSIATILGAVAAGAFVRRRDPWHGLIPFAAAQGLALVLIGLYQLGPITLLGFGALNALENFAGGGVAVCIFAAAMAVADRRVGGSFFTAAQVIYMSGSMVAGPLAGLIADDRGYTPVILTGGLMAASLALMAPRFRRGRTRE